MYGKIIIYLMTQVMVQAIFLRKYLRLIFTHESDQYLYIHDEYSRLTPTNV